MQLSKWCRNEQDLEYWVGKQDKSLVGLQPSDKLTIVAEGQRSVQQNVINPN